MVTAEAAMAVPVLVVVLLVGVWLLACVAAEIRCVDAASAAAAAASRGQLVLGPTVRGLAPAGAQLRVTRGGGRVEVVVSTTVHPFGGLVHLPGMRVSGRAVAVLGPPS